MGTRPELRLTRNLSEAQEAYAKGNTDKLIKSHSPTSIEPPPIYEPAHKSNLIKDHMHKYGKAAIFGGSFSLVIMSILASVVHAVGLSYGVFVGFGGISVISGSLFIGYSDYMNQTYERELIRWERRRESWEYDNYLEGEQREMVELYEKKGMPKEEAEKVIELMSKYKEAFVDLMMVEELGLLAPIWTPLQHGLAVFFSFLFFGALVLAPSAAYIQLWDDARTPLSLTAYKIVLLLAGAAVFGLGSLKSYFIEGKQWWKPGLLELSTMAVAVLSSHVLGGYIRPFIV